MTCPPRAAGDGLAEPSSVPGAGTAFGQLLGVSEPQVCPASPRPRADNTFLILTLFSTLAPVTTVLSIYSC